MEPGHRLIPQAVEYYAEHEPERAYAIAPVVATDAAKGYRTVTFAQLANAANRAAHWLDATLGKPATPFEAFAFQAPNDLRLPIMALAAAKCARKIVLPSRVAHRPAQEHVIKQAGSVAYLRASTVVPVVECAEMGVREVVLPELDELLDEEKVDKIAYGKSWKEGKDDPWIVLHTSGTTGLPKIMPYTQDMMAIPESVALLSAKEGRNIFSNMQDQRCYSSIPMFHIAGTLSILSYPSLLNCTAAVGPSYTPPTNFEDLCATLDATQPTGVMLPPGDIEKLAATPEGLARLKKLKSVAFVGAPLRKSLGDELVRAGVVIRMGIGTTETGGYMQLMGDNAVWDWLSFSPSMGVEFDAVPGVDELRELVIRRRPGCERFQQVFKMVPGVDEWHSKDLWYQHPSRPDMWKLAGRMDDYVKFSHGSGVYAARLEEMIVEQEPMLEAVMVDGVGHARPCLVVMPKASARNSMSEAEIVDAVWPTVQMANKTSSNMAQIPKELIIVTDADRPFALTAKNTLSRPLTRKIYGPDMQKLYAAFEASS